MRTVLEAIDERFPCKPIIHFAKPHRRLGGMVYEGASDFRGLAEMYSTIEVPYEIVKHIYELGWNDAKDAVRKELV
jgi:hypothetical protein